MRAAAFALSSTVEPGATITRYDGSRIMEWFTPSDSTCVRRAGYDGKRRELRIVYENGREYGYRDVPPRVFRDMVNIDRTGNSVGQFVNWVVKPIFRDCFEVVDN